MKLDSSSPRQTESPPAPPSLREWLAPLLYPLPADGGFSRRGGWFLAAWAGLLVILLFGVVAPFVFPDEVRRWTQVEPISEMPAPSAGGYPAGTRLRDCRDDTCPWLVVIPAGKFLMGSPANEEGRSDDEGPQHEVTIAKPLAVMEAEVTRGQFAAFVKAKDYKQASGGCAWNAPGFDQTDAHPVVCISWNDAQAYIKWLAGKTGQGYRLLSEAEWEYAARAKTPTRYSFGDKDADLCAYANIADKSANVAGNVAATWATDVCSDGFAYTAPVKTYKPNAFGLFDLHGNAWEWVQDCWHGDYNGAPVTGVSWETNCKEERRVLRGGGWGIGPSIARAADRDWDTPGYRVNYTGFRLARTLTP